MSIDRVVAWRGQPARAPSLWAVVWLSWLLLPALPGQGEVEEYRALCDSGRDQLRRGALLRARQDFEELYDILLEDEVAAVDPFRIACEVGLQEIELRRGKYEAVAAALDRLPAAARADRAVVLLRAEADRRVGAYQAAADRLAALSSRMPDDCVVRLRLAEVLDLDGQRARARELWQQNASVAPLPDDAEQLAAIGHALFRLGGRDNYLSADRVLLQSIQRDDGLPDARITRGLLRFAVHGESSRYPSGEKDLKKVLEVNGENEAALLALYRIRSANMMLDAARTEQFLDRVLDRNPRCVEALVLRAANILDLRRFDDAAERLDAALAINANHRVALAHRATAALLLRDDEGYQRCRERALAGDAGWPVCDRIVGDHLVALYRFADAVPFYEAALAADGDHVDSLHGLARAAIYLGDGARARQLLERAGRLQPGINDPWRENALALQRLLEADYEVVESGGFRMLLHRQDQEVLRNYLLPLHQEAVDVLGAKYGWRPDQQTTVEVFHTWDDFSVRTIGFRGFTALGACFGRLITLVSPGDGDLRRQDFMWEATAWHEYTHVLTLGVSRHRVPRWLTEGFSVYEERQRDRSWERGMQRDLFDAFHNGEIPPVRLMNRLFRGPNILFGYYQGGLIVELIAERYGFDKALELLRGFGDDLSLERVFDRALGISSAAFDREFVEHVETRLLRGMKLVPRYSAGAVKRLEAAAARDPNDLEVRVQLAWAALQVANPVDAGRWLGAVLRVRPDHPGGLLVRAEMLRRRDEAVAAVEHWQRAFAAGADDFDSRIRCGDTLLGLGRDDEAAAMWQRAKACWPKCTEQQNAPELRLARLYRDRGDVEQAQMEMKAYVRRTGRAFGPRYELAAFERASGNREEELRLLRECNRIDPFHREMHVQMADAYEHLERPAEAARELEVAAAVQPGIDRAYLSRDAERPLPDGAAEQQARGALWLRAATLRHELGDREGRDRLLQRIRNEAAGSDAAAAALRLQQQWQGR